MTLLLSQIIHLAVTKARRHRCGYGLSRNAPARSKRRVARTKYEGLWLRLNEHLERVGFGGGAECVVRVQNLVELEVMRN